MAYKAVAVNGCTCSRCEALREPGCDCAMCIRYKAVLSNPGSTSYPDAEAPARASILPTEAKARKQYPIATGVVDYFPDALAAIAHVSFVGNEQHNPGSPLHWDRTKSTDEADTAMRHFTERGTLDKDGLRHTAKFAWRALAILQKEIEAEQK